MKPGSALMGSITPLVAADPAFLGAVTALHVHLIIAPFNPLADPTYSSLTPATFAGSAAKNCGTGTQQTFTNPVSGQRTIQLLEPAGGFFWLCTANPAAAETVYGFAVTDTADAVILGSELFDTPVVISASGQGVSIPWIRLALLNNALG